MKTDRPFADHPLYVPRCERGERHTVSLTKERAEKIVAEVAGPLNVRRPGGTPSLAALLDAIATGKLAVVRRDDVMERATYVGRTWPVAKMTASRGCPEEND